MPKYHLEEGIFNIMHFHKILWTYFAYVTAGFNSYKVILLHINYWYICIAIKYVIIDSLWFNYDEFLNVGQKLITIIFLQSIHSLLTKLFCLRCYRQKVIKTIIICSFNESIFDYLWNELKEIWKKLTIKL